MAIRRDRPDEGKVVAVKITRLSIAGSFPWVLVEIETDAGIAAGYIHLNERPGHGLVLNEDVARAHLKPGASFFGDEPHA